jgi:hypothetical protein
MKCIILLLNTTGGITMKYVRGFIAISVCSLFLVSLMFVPSISKAQTEGAAGGSTASGEGAGAADAGTAAGTGAAAGMSKGTIAAIVVGAAVVAGGIAAASGGGGGGGSGIGFTSAH